jgi:DNA-binding GntR family transcriptional regulator
MEAPTKTNASENLRRSVLIEYYSGQPQKNSKSVKTYEAFIKMIEGGYWTPGDKIPSEKELAEILPVGLATVQTALGRLVQAGLLERRRKAGSFVAEPAAAGREITYFTFLGDDGFLPVDDVELRIFETREQGRWSQFISHSSKYICVERLIDVGGEFRIFIRFYLSDPKFGSLLRMDLEELKDITFRIMFRDRFGMPPLGFERDLSFVRLDVEVAQKLERPAGSTALVYEVYQYTLRDEPLFFMETTIPENNRVLKLGLSGTPSSQ